MQVVVMTGQYQPDYGTPGFPYAFACCFLKAYGPIFDARPNAVSTVATSLPVVEQPKPSGSAVVNPVVANDDFLALSVLDPNTSLPIVNDSISVLSDVSPAPTPATDPAPDDNSVISNGTPGEHVNMNADLRTSVCLVPRVAGDTLSTTKRLLKAYGCAVGRIIRKRRGAKHRGRVIAQKPFAGTRHPVGTAVNLVVGR